MYWYEEDIRQLEKAHPGGKEDPGIIFYGSSSIRLWNSLERDFPAWKVTNLGFGGSTLAACVWFFDRIMTGYHPKAFVIYAGDNDLGDGRNPEEIFIFFQQLMVCVSSKFADVPCYFISLKPSLARWQIADKFLYTNNLIENEIIKVNANWKFIDVFKKMLNRSGKPDPFYYDTDGLHLSEAGYRLWAEIVEAKFAES